MVRRLVQVILFCAAIGVAPHLSVGEKIDEFAVVGRQMLATINSEFTARITTHGAMRITEMTDVCEKFPFAGKTWDQANRMLKAAGQKFDLIPYEGPTSKPNQFAGGVVLANDGFAYSAVFNITLQASMQTAGGRTIESVVYCNVLTRSL